MTLVPNETEQALNRQHDVYAAAREEYRKKIAEQAAEIERLRAALEDVMIGGNSLAQIIGADHPPHGTPYSEALAHYGGGVKYEAWCCWNTIMQARAALEEGRT